MAWAASLCTTWWLGSQGELPERESQRGAVSHVLPQAQHSHSSSALFHALESSYSLRPAHIKREGILWRNVKNL